MIEPKATISFSRESSTSEMYNIRYEFTLDEIKLNVDGTECTLKDFVTAIYLMRQKIEGLERDFFIAVHLMKQKIEDLERVDD